jgi:hypothetical protein
MAAVILRTCRFLPSVSLSSIQHVGTFFLNLIGTERGGNAGSECRRRTFAERVRAP